MYDMSYSRQVNESCFVWRVYVDRQILLYIVYLWYWHTDYTIGLHWDAFVFCLFCGFLFIFFIGFSQFFIYFVHYSPILILPILPIILYPVNTTQIRIAFNHTPVKKGSTHFLAQKFKPSHSVSWIWSSSSGKKIIIEFII